MYYFPGLVAECRQFLQTYDLPNIIDRKVEVTKNQWKSLVKTKLNSVSQKEIYSEFSKYSKLTGTNFEMENLEIKD